MKAGAAAAPGHSGAEGAGAAGPAAATSWTAEPLHNAGAQLLSFIFSLYFS